ncbi:MAG: sulfotransferase domain-containing protein [Chloroflexota bacterium]
MRTNINTRLVREKVARIQHLLVRAQRVATSQQRVLPDFMIFGVTKSGSTACHRYLRFHPNILTPLIKEPNYFAFHYNQGRHNLAWYRAHFPLEAEMRKRELMNGHPTQTFEASVSYIDVPYVSERIKKLMPNIKLIALLRNPIDRAYSHYHHNIRYGHDTLSSFEAALEHEDERLQKARNEFNGDTVYESLAHRRLNYLRRGLYAQQLKPWFETFPREQFLFLTTEDLYANTAAHYEQIIDFIEVPRFQPKEFKRYYSGSYEKMNPETRIRLIEHFRPHNQELYDLLRRNLNWDR